MENTNIVRDYDKNPIIIKDYNNIFLILFGISVIPYFSYLYFYNPGNMPEHLKSVHFFILIPLYILPSFKRVGKTIGKRYIKLTEDSITFLENENVIEKINIEDINKVNRTYHDYYHLSQKHNSSILGKILNIIVIPAYQIILIFNKFLFHLKMNGLKNYKFFDSIILFSNENFITILPTTNDERKDIEVYFKLKKDMILKNQNIYYNFSYKEEEIN